MMYDIGFVSFNELDKEKYIEALRNTQLHVNLISKDEAAENANKYDGIIIEENHSQNIGMICELIILIKKESNPFVWVISNRKNNMNHIVYLQLGADGILDEELDFEVSKLFLTNTLNRCKNKDGASIDRKEQSTKSASGSDFHLRPCNYSVVLNGTEINLTKLEFKAIEFLQTQQGVAVSYEEIYKNVWENEGNDKQYRVSNLIFHLRQKIETDAARPVYIKTVRSKGYKLAL
ncbi:MULTISPECIES: winged helix-turn-helix domain-containing protein [unclassified Enterococcus]|nr:MULTISPECIES: winged helix-turn-helix domain-containing protein [unclassified Enterococcus]